MKSILFAGLSGFLKGALGAHDGPSRGFGDVLVAAAREEITYRAAPAALAAAMGRTAPRGLGAAIFAADHLLGERHTVASGAARFADVFLGGLLYEDAYRTHGLLGAIAAHAAHNFAVYAGTAAHRIRRPRKEFGHCRPMKRSKRR